MSDLIVIASHPENSIIVKEPNFEQGFSGNRRTFSLYSVTLDTLAYLGLGVFRCRKNVVSDTLVQILSCMCRTKNKSVGFIIKIILWTNMLVLKLKLYSKVIFFIK